MTGAARLVGDVGGTNARFALVESGSREPRLGRTLACRDFPDLAAAVESYLSMVGGPAIREAAVAVATPVAGDRVQFTNSPWQFSIEATRQRLGFDRLVLLNDFTALALALPLLRPDERRQVGGGAPVPDAPIGLIGAGTGLGVSGLVPAGDTWIPISGEGGHTTFSPADPRECEVLRRLWAQYDHVSTERLVQGAGLLLLYRTLCAIDDAAAVAETPEAVSEAAGVGSDAHAVEAVDRFCGILGTAASNLVLTLGARGGLYVGGGIVPALGARFDRSPFRARFEAKGRFRDYLAAIPTYVITARDPALRGAATCLELPGPAAP